VIIPSQSPEARVRDRDHDGLSNGFERKRSHTNPRKADTDGDRLRDGFELRRSHTNPRKADTDGDGLRDRFEPRRSKTNPRRKDTDRDGYSDGLEVLLGSNPRRANSIPGNPIPGKPGSAPTVAPPSTLSPGVNCMPNPSACGFPDVENTGPRVAAGDLQLVNSNVTLDRPGQIYENKDVHGCITVTAANITVRNVRITGCGGVFGPPAGNAMGLLLEDVEIDDDGDLFGTQCCSNFTARRVFFHNGGDCVTAEANVTVEDSFCTMGPDHDDDGWADSTDFCNDPEAHFDGFQSDFTMSNVTFHHNTIRNPCNQTSAILIGHVGPTSRDIVIDQNLMAGGGYTVYCEDLGRDVPRQILTNNRFSRVFFPNAGSFGPTTSCATPDVLAAGNVWDNTGARLRPR
jgi:Bacterial TSP3 repeat